MAQSLPPSTSTHPAHSRRIVCLTGFMGSGKSTVGQLLARQLGWRFVDLDRRVVERAGMDIPEFFRLRGESAFRELEREELERSLGEARDPERATVIALGGGTLTQAVSAQQVRESGAALIWLECPVDELLARCARITNRPLFRDEASFRKLYDERRPHYESAEYRVRSATEPRRVVEQILALGILERVSA